MNQTGIIILAAGESARLGRPKQLLPFADKTLVEHICKEALAVKGAPVIVVTGAYADKVSRVLEDMPLTIEFNEHWKTGMASGIVVGVSKMISAFPQIKKVIISVCDQPFISAQIFKELIQKSEETDRGIVACTYNTVLGTPVLFTRLFFEDLLSLQGAEGAKRILKAYGGEVASIPFENGEIDIDSEEDYTSFMSLNKLKG